MTLKNIVHIVLVICALGLFATFQNCSDFLEQEPGSQVSITEQLSSKQGVLEALSGLYTDMEVQVRNERFAVYADVQGGNIKFTPGLGAGSKGQIIVPINIENVYDFQDDARDSDYENVYDGGYDVINQANLILEFVDALTDASDAEKSQIKAEALTIRAYTHFLLSLLYSQPYNFTPDASHLGIVYNTVTLTNGITYPERKTAFDTYRLIIEDIETALALYTDSSAIPEEPKYSYFNMYSTKALLARVYLYQNNWQKAHEIADDVIKNSGVSLTPREDYIAQWELPMTPVSEILLEFSVPISDEGIAGATLSQYFGYFGETAYGDYVASNDLLTLYETSDVRGELFLEQQLSTIVNENEVDLPYYFTKKFQDVPGYPAFRLSEQYLIRAEAAFNLGQLDNAKNDINAIRDRANASLFTGTINLEDILLERRKELCFEGHYYFDLIRNKKDIVRNDGCISDACNLSYPSPKMILPLPQDNLNINSNLIQNDSY